MTWLAGVAVVEPKEDAAFEAVDAICGDLWYFGLFFLGMAFAATYAIPAWIAAQFTTRQQASIEQGREEARRRGAARAQRPEEQARRAALEAAKAREAADALAKVERALQRRAAADASEADPVEDSRPPREQLDDDS